MIPKIENCGFIYSNDIQRIDAKSILDLALTYNRLKSSKISIFKSFQAIDYSIGEYREIICKIKEYVLSDAAINRLIDENYCIYENNLFFISHETAETLSIIKTSSNTNEKIHALKTLKSPFGLTSDEINLLINSGGDPSDKSSNVHLRVELYPYQKEGFRWLREKYFRRLGGILADDMGLGKTAQVIALIVDVLSSGCDRRVLIIVPNSLIANWINEFKKFSVGINPFVHWGSERNGFASQIKDFPVIISTYSTVANDINLFDKLFFDILVCDEASLLKNPDSQRTICVNRIRAASTFEITGTPFENSMLDLWSLSNIVDKNFLGERNSFEKRFVSKGITEINDNDISQIEQTLRPILLRRMKHDVLKDLPIKQDIYKPLTMTEQEQTAYNRLEDQIRSCAEGGNAAFALISYLRKYTAHPLLNNNSLVNASIKELEMASAKFSFLLGLINRIRFNAEKAIVFANHISILDAFTKVFKKELGIESFKIDGSVPAEDRQTVVDDFSAMQGSALLFLNPITAGMGLNITSANHVIHYSRQWNPALEEQATARAYRNGQKKAVNVYYLYYADSVEELMHERLIAKTYVSSNVVKASTEFKREEDLLYQLILERGTRNV